MRDADEIAKVKIHDIMQIVPTEDHGFGKRIMAVSRIETWGVHLTDGVAEFSRTWNLVEPTGGVLRFDLVTGKPAVQPEPPERHNP